MFHFFYWGYFFFIHTDAEERNHILPGHIAETYNHLYDYFKFLCLYRDSEVN